MNIGYSKTPVKRSSSSLHLFQRSSFNRRQVINGFCILISILFGTFIALSIGFYLAIYATQLLIRQQKFFLSSTRFGSSINYDPTSIINEHIQFRTTVMNLPKDISKVSRQFRTVLPCTSSSANEETLSSVDELFSLFPSENNQSTITNPHTTNQEYLFSSIRSFPWYIQERIGLYFHNIAAEMHHQQLYNKYRCYYDKTTEETTSVSVGSTVWKNTGSPRALFLIGSTVRSWSSTEQLMHTDRLADQITSLLVTLRLFGWETKIISLSRELLFQKYSMVDYFRWLFEADSIFIDLDGLQEYFDITCSSVIDNAYSNTETYPFILRQFPSLLSRLYIFTENGKYTKTVTNIKNCLENLGFEEKHLLNGLYGTDTVVTDTGPTGFSLGYFIPSIQQLTYEDSRGGSSGDVNYNNPINNRNSIIIQQPSRINGVYLHVHTFQELQHPQVQALIRLCQENNYEVHVGIDPPVVANTNGLLFTSNEQQNLDSSSIEHGPELPEQIINHGRLSTDGLRMVLRLLKIFIDFGGEWKSVPSVDSNDRQKGSDDVPTGKESFDFPMNTNTQEDMDIFHAAAAGCYIFVHQSQAFRDTELPLAYTTSTGYWILRKELKKGKNNNNDPNLHLTAVDLSQSNEIVPLLQKIESQTSSETFVPYILPVMRTSVYLKRVEELINNVLQDRTSE